MVVIRMSLESFVGGYGCYVEGDESGQTFTLHRDGRMWLSRFTCSGRFGGKDVMSESVFRLFPGDVAADILDTVESSTRGESEFVTDVTPWKLVLTYEFGTEEVRWGSLDVPLSNGGSLSKYIRRRLASAPVDYRENHGLGRPFMPMLDVDMMLLFPG